MRLARGGDAGASEDGGGDARLQVAGPRREPHGPQRCLRAASTRRGGVTRAGRECAMVGHPRESALAEGAPGATLERDA